VSKVVSRRTALVVAAIVVLGVAPTIYMRATAGFPPDTTPEGAYLRIALAVGEDKLIDAFAYLETESQWACFSLFDYERRAYDVVAASYPEPERARLLAQYDDAHRSATGQELFARLAHSRGWAARLRKDLSGIARVETSGERATVETARGTRYPFRRRENGIWGLTIFTGELRESAQRAARDFSVVEKAAADYAAK
jgi:hypothetical protein